MTSPKYSSHSSTSFRLNLPNSSSHQVYFSSLNDLPASMLAPNGSQNNGKSNYVNFLHNELSCSDTETRILTFLCLLLFLTSFCTSSSVPLLSSLQSHLPPSVSQTSETSLHLGLSYIQSHLPRRPEPSSTSVFLMSNFVQLSSLSLEPSPKRRHS